MMERRRMQEETLCKGAGLTTMLATCCPSQGGNGHRRFLQEVQGCDALPTTCPVACAPLFIEYFERCQGIIEDLKPDERQGFQELYGNCEEVEQATTAMLQDARPAMIFHVVVMDVEAAARQAQSEMPGGGRLDQSFGPPLIGPKPAPSPSPPTSGGAAEIAQEFRRICTTANLTDCVPRCNRFTYGFLLSIEIDRRGTVMTCNKMGLLFSWQGQASLGGYIGDDFQAFFSSVVSGAAGTYITKLDGDAGISMDLRIEPGQTVMVSGDEALVVAPAWGSGGFAVQQFGSLAIARISLMAVALRSTLASFGPGGRLALNRVSVVGHPELGELTGLVTARQVSEPLTIEPQDLFASLPAFTVLSGPCTVAEGGRCVGRWPGGYLPNEDCEIIVSGPGGVLGTCPVFDIQDTPNSDFIVTPDGRHHDSADCPSGLLLGPGRTVTWHSDDTIQGHNNIVSREQLDFFGGGLRQNYHEGAGGGWQICFDGGPLPFDDGQNLTLAGASCPSFSCPAYGLSGYDCASRPLTCSSCSLTVSDSTALVLIGCNIPIQVHVSSL
jgi:hypothetical protein